MQNGIIFALLWSFLFPCILRAQTASAEGGPAEPRQESASNERAKPQAADLNSLRAQIDTLKVDYEKRIRALETQLEEIQAQMLRITPEEETAAAAAAQRPSAQVTYNALNPAISVIGNFLGRGDNRNVFNGDFNRIDNDVNLREVEFDMRVPVDPFADAVVILSLDSDKPGRFETEIEEGYVNIKKLPFIQTPLGLKFQVGRFRPAFGKNNVLHLHDLPQSFRPLPIQEFLGQEGFIQQGFSTDFYIPTPWDANESLNAKLQVLGGGDIAISPESHNRLAYLGNLRWFRTFHGTHNTEVGWSSYWHPGSKEASIARVHAVDFMYRWKPFRQGEWKSYLLSGELLFSDRSHKNAAEPPEVLANLDPGRIRNENRRPFGYSIFTQWQLDRRKYIGARWDYTSTLHDPGLHRRSLTPYLSYYFSEFLRLRFNYEHRWSDFRSEDNRNSFFVELNWVFGSHPPEPFWVNK